MANPRYIVRFVSKASGAGKTRVASRVVSLLRMKGYVVGVVKHCTEITLEEKDSKKYIESGAVVVVASSPGLLVVYSTSHPDTLESTLYHVQAPIVVVEGYKHSSIGDVVVVSEKPEEAVELAKSLSNVIAIVTRKSNTQLPQTNTPVFDFEEVELLANLVESRALEYLTSEAPGLNCQMCGYASCKELARAYMKGASQWCPVKSGIRVLVDGYEVQLNPFVKNMIRSTVLGLISPLKGVLQKPSRVVIEVS